MPLAYGIFCATFDVFLAACFYARRGEWGAALESKAQGQRLTQATIGIEADALRVGYVVRYSSATQLAALGDRGSSPTCLRRRSAEWNTI